MIKKCERCEESQHGLLLNTDVNCNKIPVKGWNEQLDILISLNNYIYANI